MIEFQVNDMTCGHCVGAITEAVATVDPLADVEVDLQTHRVRVKGSDHADAIQSAIVEAGYTPVRVA